MAHWVDDFPAPHGPVVEALLERLRRLPLLAGWAPKHGLQPRRPHVLHWAHVLSLLDSFTGHDALINQFCEEIIAADAPQPNTFAELSAAALAGALGAASGRRLDRAATPTADWRITWPPDAAVDVEVTVGRQKAEHVRRHDAANGLLNYFTAKDRTDDLVIHIADPTNREDATQVIETVSEVEPNGSIDNSGRWSVRRVQVSRDTFAIYSGFDEAPSWWPRGVLRQIVFEVVLAGPESTQAPGQVRVLFGVPAIAYINPVMKKADRPQGEEGRPFLLAVDVLSLPGAFSDLPQQIDGFFEQWSRVSGILLFADLPAMDRSAWRWRLLPNPHAVTRLPESLTRVLTLETGMPYDSVSRGGRNAVTDGVTG